MILKDFPWGVIWDLPAGARYAHPSFGHPLGGALRRNERPPPGILKNLSVIIIIIIRFLRISLGGSFGASPQALVTRTRLLDILGAALRRNEPPRNP